MAEAGPEPGVVPFPAPAPAIPETRDITPKEARELLAREPLIRLLDLYAGAANSSLQNVVQGTAKTIVKIAQSTDENVVSRPLIEGAATDRELLLGREILRLRETVAEQEKRLETLTLPKAESQVLAGAPLSRPNGSLRGRTFGMHDVTSKAAAALAQAVQRVRFMVRGPLSRITGVMDIVNGDNDDAISIFSELAAGLTRVSNSLNPTERGFDKDHRMIWISINRAIEALGHFDFRFGKIISRPPVWTHTRTTQAHLVPVGHPAFLNIGLFEVLHR